VDNKTALYHRVMRRENFETAAKDLVCLLKTAETKSPGMPRILYVDIDGHRNENGGFDSDMLELQTKFGVGFLSQFFTEVHFPLVSFENPNPQRNDVPDKLDILNPENKRDDSLNELFVENYSNTEFMSEEDVYDFLKIFSAFLKEYNDFSRESVQKENPDFDPLGWMKTWRRHMDDLINELFDCFLYGNLLSTAAMTRTLIECYVYYSVLVKEKNERLLDEWYLCSVCRTADGGDRREELVRSYCELRKLNFNEKWEFFSKNKRVDAWLAPVLPKGRSGISAACEYLDVDNAVYEDYQRACAFVHGQDLTSKVLPFAFYSSVFSKLYMMIFYIFKTVRLFGLNAALEARVRDMEKDLLRLAEKYCM